MHAVLRSCACVYEHVHVCTHVYLGVCEVVTDFLSMCTPHHLKGGNLRLYSLQPQKGARTHTGNVHTLHTHTHTGHFGNGKLAMDAANLLRAWTWFSNPTHTLTPQLHWVHACTNATHTHTPSRTSTTYGEPCR